MRSSSARLAGCALLFAAACTGGNTNAPSPTVIVVTAPVVSVIDPAPASGAPIARPPGKHEVLATLQRTACYGTCPIYQVTIYADGTLEYVGERFVKTMGAASGQITRAEIDELRRAFDDAHYFDLDDSYEKYEVTDHPSANTSFTDKGRTKHIKHYHGDRSAPKALNELEAAIDRIIHIEQFIGTAEERDKMRMH